MRTTAREVVRHPSWFGAWVYDAPWRHRYFWREVLFAPGGGWLRWKKAYAEDWDYIDGYAYDAGGSDVFPPMRRVWLWLAVHVAAPFNMAHGYEWQGERKRLSWEEVVCSFSDIPSDPDRKQLWR